MELSYKELKKRDVINLADGKNLGRITDIRLVFPEGTLIGITVPGKKTCILLNLFDKSEIYIPESKIIKIGGDAILVDLSCGESCSENVVVNKTKSEKCCEKQSFPCGFIKNNCQKETENNDYSEY